MRDRSKWLLILLGILLAAGYSHRLGRPNLDARDLEYGFYQYENWEQGKIRWTGKRAVTMITPEADVFGIKVVAFSQNSSPPEGLNLKVFLDDRQLENTWFFNGGQQYLYWYVPEIAGQQVRFRMAVNRAFCPADLGINQDSRLLGVAVSPIMFLRIMPADGIGFHKPAAVNGTPSCRWTRKQASLPAGQCSRTLYLRCSHPDIARRPVKVKISGDGTVLQELTFSGHDWQKVVLDDRALAAAEVVTFAVSRTWNPRQMGMGEDDRDLGVAVRQL